MPIQLQGIEAKVFFLQSANLWLIKKFISIKVLIQRKNSQTEGRLSMHAGLVFYPAYRQTEGIHVVNIHLKTIVQKITCISLLCLLLLVAVPVVSADSNATVTTAPDVTAIVTPAITPTPVVTTAPTTVPSATPVPTPAPRKIFSSAKWENDHVSMLVTNNGGPVTVEAYIDDPSNKITTSVTSGANIRINTNSITAESGQIIVFGFKAYDNGTRIDSFESTLVAGQTQVSPTPPAETATLSGTVVDATSNAPVTDAIVELKSQSYNKRYTTTTDNSGGFTVENIYPDTYDIIINANGYRQELRHSASRIEGAQQMDPIAIQKVPSGTTPTPVSTPTPSPTPSPSSPLDAWLALLYTPTACIATITGTVGLIVSLTILYEWFMRQKERRLREGQQTQQQQQQQQQIQEQQQKIQEQQQKIQDQQDQQSSGDAPGK